MAPVAIGVVITLSIDFETKTNLSALLISSIQGCHKYHYVLIGSRKWAPKYSHALYK
jgi:hypothetical protein